jgi:hypothetical protein
MLHVVGRVSKAFALGLENEVSAISAEVDALAARQMASTKALPDVD